MRTVMRTMLAGLLVVGGLSAAPSQGGALYAEGELLFVHVLHLETDPCEVAPCGPQYHYSVKLLQEGPFTATDADVRAKEIGVAGIRQGTRYYPPNMVQRITFYTTP